MAKDSNITGCIVMARDNISFLAAEGRGPAMFEEGGNLTVTLDRMLIVPLEAFTPRQLRKVQKRVRDLQASTATP